eukprot:6004380-Prymnesium_polylepis.1
MVEYVVCFRNATGASCSDTGREKVTPSREKATATHAHGGSLTGKSAISIALSTGFVSTAKK